MEPVADTRNREDDGKIIFSFYSLLDDLEMKEAEKSTAKSLSKSNRRIFLIDEGCVNQRIFFESNRQIFIILGVIG